MQPMTPSTSPASRQRRERQSPNRKPTQAYSTGLRMELVFAGPDGHFSALVLIPGGSMRSRAAWAILVLIVVLILIGFMRFNLTALEEPGRFETAVANRGRRFLVHRASRQGIPPAPADKKASIASGDTLYGLECGMCHGPEGHGQV